MESDLIRLLWVHPLTQTAPAVGKLSERGLAGNRWNRHITPVAETTGLTITADSQSPNHAPSKILLAPKAGHLPIGTIL